MDAKKQTIISLSGFGGSGKDSMAEVIVNEYGYRHMSFSSILKDVVAAIFGWERSLLEGLTLESRDWRETEDAWWSERLDLGVPVTPKFVLRNIGTDLFRDQFHQDIWTLAFEKKLMQSKVPVVVTDTRHFNEFYLLGKHGAYFLGIYRRTPQWLKEFYQRTDQLLFANGWVGIKSMNMLDPNPVYRRENHEVVEKCGTEALVDMKISLHSSEWMHLLFPHYDALHHNNGTLADLKAAARELILKVNNR